MIILTNIANVIYENDHVYVIILILVEKNIKMIILWFLQGSVPNQDILKSIECDVADNIWFKMIFWDTIPL